MPHPYQADERSKCAAGPAGKVAYCAKPDGRFYDYEELVTEEVTRKRKEGVIVFAQGHYYALREASRELQLSPEHIVLNPTEKTYRVYVLECTTRTVRRVTVHVGIALDVAKRVEQHRRGEVKATRGREIVWLGNSGRMSHPAALRLEVELKKLRPVQKRAWAAEQDERNTKCPA